MIITSAHLSVYDRPDVDQASVDRQFLAGEKVEVLQVVTDANAGVGDIWAKVRAEKDGYAGFVERAYLQAATAKPTHFIAAREAPVTARPEVKFGPTSGVLFLGSLVEVVQKTKDRTWAQVQLQSQSPIGWVYEQHLRPLSDPPPDPVAVARQFLGSPYVWGGNTGRGIDCSGLVQAALLAAGVGCPGDSGPQHDAFVEPGRTGAFEAGELLFWKGHVAMATGPSTMIHATAHSMSVIEEPIEPALRRIAAQGDAPWRGRGRAPRP